MGQDAGLAGDLRGAEVGEAGWAEHQAARAVAAASPGGLAKLCRKKWSLTNTKGSGDAMFHVASKVGIVFLICEDDRRECEMANRKSRGCQAVRSSHSKVVRQVSLATMHSSLKS